tara:strand:- start:1836 stop:2354 length:519 start_codon:yes stop_codon:yes gene_type:complete
MLLQKEHLESINKEKVTYIKDFTQLNRIYDFNLISSLMEENNLTILSKTNVSNLKNVFQMCKVSNCLKEFTTFFDFLSKLFKYERDPKDEIDLFFSLTTQIGDTHVDTEDVFIIGLTGKTIYRFYEEINTDYCINKGDMIFIPKNIKHKAIGLTPRIIASIGFFGKKIGKNL